MIARAAGLGETAASPTTTSTVPDVRADDVAQQVAAVFASGAYDAPDLAAQITGARRHNAVLIFETTLTFGDRDAVSVCVAGQETSDQVEVHDASDNRIASTHPQTATDGSPFYFCDIG